MSHDPTQHQSDDERTRARELSRQRSVPPLKVPGYETRSFLGSGAYGEVWVAVDQNTGRRVAIKFYTKRSHVDWSSMSREVEKLVFLSADRYVVQLLDVGWDADPPYYVMEYVEGGSLQQLIDRDGSLPADQSVEMFRDICTGLLHAHGKGVLHCDLKPANILLDQDQKPRLADFGQSRLSHEQTPALGTLFFMAPEQADLAAVPDARWDVYALGAMFFCMLTGQPPYRSEKFLSEIDSAPTLTSRLDRYRQELYAAPQPAEHRQIKGVDRDLVEIIDRCLNLDPKRRFPNVQSVLTALRGRDISRARRPLITLGLLGPLVFLAVLGLFTWSAHRNSVQRADSIVKRWTYESSRFAAKFAAETVARGIDGYFRQVESQASDPELQDLVFEITRKDSDSARWLADVIGTDQILEAESRKKFVAHAKRRVLQDRIDALMKQTSRQKVASWFITDTHGVHLASSFGDRADSTVGIDYSYRNYFHGQDRDLATGLHHAVEPLTETKLSHVFRSTATGAWKVAVSTPMIRENEVIGVVALTVELGRLGDKFEFSSQDRCVVLVDGRIGVQRGAVLQHPLFNTILQRDRRLPDEFESIRVPIDTIPDAQGPVPLDVPLYRDPLGTVPRGHEFDRRWIAVREKVWLDTTRAETGLIVLVQEDYDAASSPVVTLGEGVVRDGLMAFLLMLSGLVFLWYAVTRALRDDSESQRRVGQRDGLSTSMQSMETIEIPVQLRSRRR